MKNTWLVALTFIWGALGFCGVGSGRMMQMTTVPLQKIRADFEAKDKAGKLSAEETQVLSLVKLGQDVLGIVSVQVPSHLAENPSSIRKPALIAACSRAIERDLPWQKQLPPDAVAKIRAESALLEESFGSQSYAWAWFQFQVGDKKRAKEILARLYAEEFDRVMKLKRAVYGFNGTPLGAAEAQFRALEPMCEGEEKEKVKDQMQKMKIRVSNLPQSQIVT